MQQKPNHNFLGEKKRAISKILKLQFQSLTRPFFASLSSVIGFDCFDLFFIVLAVVCACGRGLLQIPFNK